MANKSYNLPQVGQEDINDPRLIAARYAYKHQQQQQQQQQQQIPLQPYQQQLQNRPQLKKLQQPQSAQPQPQQQQKQQREYFCYTKTIRIGNTLQEVMMKSTLNPNAKEFYPSYVRPTRNGCINPVYNILRHSAAMSYGYEKWPNFVTENNYLAPGKYMEEQVHLSIMKNNYSRNGSTNESRSTSYQEFTSLEKVDDGKDVTMENKERNEPAEDSGENVWFMNNQTNIPQENPNNEWRVKEEPQEPYMKEEFYDAASPMTDSGGDKMEKNEEEHVPEEKSLTDLNRARKKLIMLYPPKKQAQTIPEGSKESVFESPNPLSYTSDESFLGRSNTNFYDGEDVDDIIREGKQYFSHSEDDKAFNDEDDVVENASDELEPTAKASDSRRFEVITDSSTLQCDDSVAVRNKGVETPKSTSKRKTEEKSTKKYILRTKEIDIKIIRKHDTVKTRKPLTPDISENSSKVHEIMSPKKNAREIQLTYFREKRKPTTINSPTTKEDAKAPTKTSNIRIKAGKHSTATKDETKDAEKMQMKMEENPYVATGAIPKTRAAVKPTKEISTPKSIRKQPTTTTTANEQQSAVKNVRQITLKENVKKEQEKSQHKDSSSSSTAREVSSGNTTKRSNARSIDYLHNSQVPRYAPFLRNVDQKTTAANSKYESKTNPSKPLTSILAKNATNSAKKDSVPTEPKERVVHKSTVKTQMRSSANVNPTAGSKPSSSPRKDNESKKEKPENAITNRNPPAKTTTKTAAATKIPVKPKSNSLKAVKGVIGSDGDNVKITESKSCATIWQPDHKDLTKKNSEASCRIAEKSIENKKKIVPREIARSTIRHSTIKKHSLAPN